MAGLVLLFAACSKESEDMVNDAQMEVAVAPVKVHVSGFSVSQEDFPTTRTAQNLADYTGVKAVTLAFYNGSTEVLKHEQVRGALEEGETFEDYVKSEYVLVESRALLYLNQVFLKVFVI